MSRNSSIIKKKLEDTFDIPFVVEEGLKYRDPVFSIIPENSNEELFEVNVEFKNNIRIVIEIIPEKYSAFAISDMSHATEEKKNIFTQYACLLRDRKAKIDFKINDRAEDPYSFDQWPDEWNNYGCRISKSPVVSENETFDLAAVVAEWTALSVGMFLSLLNVIQTEDEEENTGLMLEGGSNKVVVNRYERNPVNRELCLSANGYNCMICGFDFQAKYGSIGEHFIHVHHIVPVSEMKTEYLINPVKDLIPVCPNCHAMLHRVSPPLTPDELRNMILKEETAGGLDPDGGQREQ